LGSTCQGPNELEVAEPVLSTVHGDNPELKFCVNIVGLTTTVPDAIDVLPPLQIVAVAGVITGAGGAALSVTVVVAVVVQVPLEPVSVYTPATAEATVGLKAVEEKPLGPVQLYVGAVVVPVSDKGDPGHTGPPLEADNVNGHGLIILAL